LQTIAILTKLAWNDTKDNLNVDVINAVNNMSQEPTQQIVGLNLLLSLLTEFESLNSSSLGLSLDFHQLCHAAFQNTQLINMFQLVLQVLHKNLQLQDNQDIISIAVVCLEKILCWNFDSNLSVLLNKREEGHIEKEQPLLKLPAGWKAVIGVPEVILLFFELQNRYFENPLLEPKISACLVQLAGVHGPVFDSLESRYSYVSNFMMAFNQYLKM
jgi:hypothetical protein